ncbi:MAG: hypothetical protein HY078_12945 [Elusimicrobia bacterium]|nr:hypothetical protein [Elusimicrobiota bacterium]
MKILAVVVAAALSPSLSFGQQARGLLAQEAGIQVEQIRSLHPDTGRAPDVFSRCGGFDVPNARHISPESVAAQANRCLHSHGYAAAGTPVTVNARIKFHPACGSANPNDCKSIQLVIVASHPRYTGAANKTAADLNASLAVRRVKNTLVGYHTTTHLVVPVHGNR